MEIKKIVESLNQISEGFANLASAVEAMDIVSVDVSAENVEPKTVEELKEMGFTEFKVYAASIGVKCTGTRDEIMKRVLDKFGEIEDDESEVEDIPVEEVEEVEEEPEEKPKKKVGRASKKSAPEEKEEDEYDKLAKEYAEEMEESDIIDALKDVGIKANSKNCIVKLAEALREGLLEDDDNDDDKKEEDSEVEADEVEVEIPEDNEEEEEDIELDEDSYFEDYDVFSLNDFENMSEERKSAIKEKIVSIIDKEPKEKDIQKRLKDILTREEWTDVEEADTEYNELIKMLVEREKYLIDDDGDEITKGEAYEITNNEGEVVDMCCGHPLTYVEKTKSYICEKCGANFKAE